MQEKWAHEKEAALGDDARHDRSFLFQIGDRGRIKPTVTVGTGDNLKRSVVLVAVVEMDADGEHIFKNGYRWLDMDDFVFN